jgi:hypothetical protein
MKKKWKRLGNKRIILASIKTGTLAKLLAQTLTKNLNQAAR